MKQLDKHTHRLKADECVHENRHNYQVIIINKKHGAHPSVLRNNLVKRKYSVSKPLTPNAVNQPRRLVSGVFRLAPEFYYTV